MILQNKDGNNKKKNKYMDTFKDLYEFLQLNEENNIISWLKDPWVGKDKQESLLRLFAGLGLVDKLKSYDICKGNYNKKTITKHTTIKDVFFNHENNLINLKDKGDKSDLTMICKENNKKILVTTSKNRENEKITCTPIFISIVAQALREFPLLNSSVEDYTVIKKKSINIGMATALSDGNLIVPVIKNADQLSLLGLVKKVNDLAKRSRSGQLQPDEVKEGTYTISNVGVFDTLMGTPIINQPQVGILAFGAINKKPSVIETDGGDFIGIRHKIYLSHSFDHRIVNGAMGGLFIKRIKELIENWDSSTTI